jgi:tRNA pseudouridine38-40 synthase
MSTVREGYSGGETGFPRHLMRNLKITLQYDGTDFVGWQRQDTGVSIQGLLEDALVPIEGAAVVVHGAGRTDAGVHALGQVATFGLHASIDPATLVRALNAVLPGAVRVTAAEDVEAGFHARFSAVGKVYEYRLVNAPFISPFVHRYAWHVPGRLDVAAIRDASRLLIGRRDFEAFQGSGSDVASTVRTIHRLEWRSGDGHDAPTIVHIEGDGFLRHMVRNIVGTLVDIGSGRWAAAEMASILESGDRARAGRTAPALGLFLVRVLY